jgi:hypothetical protein
VRFLSSFENLQLCVGGLWGVIILNSRADYPNTGLPIRWIPVGAEPISTDIPSTNDESDTEYTTMVPPTSPACVVEEGQTRGRIKFEKSNEEWIYDMWDGELVFLASESNGTIWRITTHPTNVSIF